jgi:predicted TIM-barrel fold metal-dependent hydrolase
MNCQCGRRHFLLGSGAAALFGASGAQAAGYRRIDVHHHVVAPAYLEAAKAAKFDNPPMSDWSPAKSLNDMDMAGISTAMLSPMPPQVGFLPAAEAARVARESNEWARKLANDHLGRYGLFAMLPLPHVDHSLTEIAYAFDTLKADGVGIMTSYGDKWLGAPEFAPVFRELNRRKAVVYTHPTGANCCVNLVKGVPDLVVEWGADTTRTIASLIFSGASAKYKDVSFIFSHGGGVLTSVAERFRIQMVQPPYKKDITREMVDRELKRFFYDTAQVANEVTIEALAKLVGMSQIVLGTDYPYRTGVEHVSGLKKHGFSEGDLARIDSGNILRVLRKGF